MRTVATAVSAVLFGLCICSCGPSGYPGIMNPAGSSPTPGSVVVIDIVGVLGSTSFRPNPATIMEGQMVVWRNLDSVTHRIGFDDRSIDTLDIDAGASSAPMTIVKAGPYHCRLYPTLTSGTVVVLNGRP